MSSLKVIHRHDRAAGDDGDWLGFEGTGEMNAAPSTLHFVVPGEAIPAEAGFLRGHNTYLADGASSGSHSVLTSSVCGAVERVNKLVCARPINSRYFPEVGDVVVGRVVEVASSQRWRVEINSRCIATLALAAVNLPGGVQRKRTEEDALHMRSILKEGDLITAEIQSINSDNVPLLHARSSRYGKLTQGILVTVPSCLVRRCKSHFHQSDLGVSFVFGVNGMAWIYPSSLDVVSTHDSSSQDKPMVTINAEVRGRMARMRNCFVILAAYGVTIYPTTIMAAYTASVEADVACTEMLDPHVAEAIAAKARLVAQL